MFFIGLSRAPLGEGLRAAHRREFPVGGQVLTVATDNRLGYIQEGPGVIDAGEAIAAGATRITLVRARCDLGHGTLEIEKPMVSGRPVYYVEGPDGSFFCSSHLGMLRAAGVAFRENAAKLPELFLFRFVSPPGTLLLGVRQMLAGERLHVSGTAPPCVATQAVYRPPPANPAVSVGQLAVEVSAALAHAIEALAGARPSLGVFLSGGLDSSLLFKITQKAHGINETYSTAYPFQDPATDPERLYALSAARAFGSEHHLYEATNAQYLRAVVEAIALAEEPLIHLQSAQLMLLCRHGLPDETRLIISGEGADSLFGQRIQQLILMLRRKPLLAAAIRWQPLLGMLRIVSGLTNRGGLALEIIDKTYQEHCDPSDPDHVLWSLDRLGREEWLRRYLGASKADAIRGRLALIEPYRDEELLVQLSLLGTLGEVSRTQSIWSKLAEATGRTLYYPFADRAVFDLAYAAPSAVKCASPKHVLRQVARDLGVPEFIVTRRKAGFGVPAALWAPRGALFEPLIALAGKAFDLRELRRMQSPESVRAHHLWTMINYGIWKRLFLNGEPLDDLLAELDEAMASSNGARRGAAGVK